MFYCCISPKEGLFDRLQFIVGQIFGIDAIAYHKQLYVLKQTVVAPKRVHLVAIDLLKLLLISDAGTFQFILYQRQTVDQKK
jgi:hypothetical protein